MDIKKFLSSYSGIRTENFYYLVICGVLLLANLVLGAAVFSRKETVVLVPPNLKEPAKVSLKKADQKYQETWALFFALLLGNITPRNIEFVAEEIEKYLSPAIYQSVMQDVVEQAQGIKEANLSTTFEPRELVLDDKTGHVLVKGQMVMRGAFGKPPSKVAAASGGVVQVEPGRNVSLTVAGDQLNRIVTPFTNPLVHTVSKAKINVDGSVVYVSIAQEDGPTTMFITENGESDPSISLTLLPQDVPPREIRLTLSGVGSFGAVSAIGNAKAAKWEKSQPYTEAIEKVMLATARGKSLRVTPLIIPFLRKFRGRVAACRCGWSRSR